MDTKTLRQWKKYNEYIAKYNKPLFEVWMKADRESMKIYKTREAEAEKQYNKEMAKYTRVVEENNVWDELPFYEKLFKPAPLSLGFHPYPTKRYIPLPMPSLFIGTKTATWENFLDWLIKEEVKK